MSGSRASGVLNPLRAPKSTMEKISRANITTLTRLLCRFGDPSTTNRCGYALLLDHFQIPLHRFTPKYERKIVLPEFSEPAEAVHHEFKTQTAPKVKHFDINSTFTEIRWSVIIILRRLIAEKPQREAG